jgi:hypothetical protein
MSQEDPFINKLSLFVWVSVVIIVANFAYMIKTNLY